MKYNYSGGKLTFHFKAVKLQLSNPMPGVWRLLSEKGGKFDEIGAAQTLSRDVHDGLVFGKCEFECSEKDGIITAREPGGCRCEISTGSIDFYDGKGSLRRRIKNIRKEVGSVKLSLPMNDDERIYGTGERLNRVNQRGKKVQMFAIDRWCWTEGNSYIPIPFLISSDCSAIFMNRYELAFFNIGKTKKSEIRIEQKNAPIDLYIFMFSNPQSVLKAYSSITGFAPMPPEWSFGTQVCRYHPEFSSKDGVFAMADEMEKNGFPWDAVIIEGWKTYNKPNWGELREISDKVHSMGKKLMVYQQCGRFPSECEENFGLTDEYAVNSKDGVWLKETKSLNLMDNFHRKKMRCIDLTSDECKEKWSEIWDELVTDIGVDGSKIDFCEQFPGSRDIKFRDGRNPMGAHHWYPTYYNILQYKRFCTRPDGGMNYSRGGGIGAQRYPFVWAGDQRREFIFFKPVITAALSLGLSGVPFVSWDMAGYQPSWNPYDKENEDKVFIRGLEFTAFSANIQTHGKVKRPYDFDEHTKAVYRAYANLHECLKPYLTEQATVSCETGVPLLRHLFFHDCTDKKVLDIEDEYTLGCALLVAPVLDKGSTRDLYLPKGEWINIFSGKEYSGNQTLKNEKVPLEAIPVFRLKNAPSEKIGEALEKAKPFIEEINKLCR